MASNKGNSSLNDPSYTPPQPAPAYSWGTIRIRDLPATDYPQWCHGASWYQRYGTCWGYRCRLSRGLLNAAIPVQAFSTSYSLARISNKFAPSIRAKINFSRREANTPTARCRSRGKIGNRPLAGTWRGSANIEIVRRRCRRYPRSGTGRCRSDNRRQSASENRYGRPEQQDKWSDDGTLNAHGSSVSSTKVRQPATWPISTLSCRPGSARASPTP